MALYNNPYQYSFGVPGQMNQFQQQPVQMPAQPVQQLPHSSFRAGRQAGGGSWQFIAQINRRTVFDEIIEEAKLRRDTSGRNPFELA